MDDKVSFIKEAIEKSGFPFEMEIASLLKEDGWEVLPSAPYWDEDEEKWREIDIKAYKTSDQTLEGESIKPYSLSVALIIECKKTDEFAWVFFPWARDTKDIELSRVNHVDFLTVIKRQSLLMGELSKGELPSRAEIRMLDLDPDLLSSYRAIVTPEIARKLKFPSELELIRPNIFRFLVTKEKALTYKEIKLKKLKNAKRDSGPPEIFEGVNVSIKATKHDMKLHSSSVYAGAELKKMGHEQGRFEIMVFLPILVLGGEIYTWCDGNVEEVNEVLLEGRCHTRRYFDNMLIEVVKGHYFKEFLSKIDADKTELLRQICSNRSKLDEQVKMIMESPWFDGYPSMRGRL
jgi:hypothetical protein